MKHTSVPGARKTDRNMEEQIIPNVDSDAGRDAEVLQERALFGGRP